MQAYKIAEKIEKFCPQELACSWDNVGFLCGDPRKEVKKVFLTLDVNEETARAAVLARADMIVSHHPILFRGIKNIDFRSPTGRMLELLIANGIVLYAAHTNMDAAPKGINAVLAQKLYLENVQVLEPHSTEKNAGLGRFGIRKKPVALTAFCEEVKAALNTPGLRVAGMHGGEIQKVAVAGGSCSELVPLAIAQGIDVIVTADIKYHEAMDFSEQGICVLDAGHYPTEVFVTELFRDILKDCKELELVCSNHKDVFQYV